MMTSDDKVDGWVKKGENHDDVILEWSPIERIWNSIETTLFFYSDDSTGPHLCAVYMLTNFCHTLILIRFIWHG